ncbi:MAG: tetratricopeptide repeat protein [Chthoniobacteraceae bacterium]
MKTLITQLAQRRLLALLLFLLAGMLAYFPALSGQFLWDDEFLVGSNPFFKSPIFFFEVFRHRLFLDALSGYYRPVQNWTYMLDYLLWDQNTFGYHLANVFYHALSAFLIWRLLRVLVPRLWENLEPAKVEGLALLTAALWVIHPIHNAAVAYVAGRADSLACIFALTAWLLVEKSRALAQQKKRVPQVLCLGLAILCTTLGLCSKEITIIWIALFLFFTFVFQQGTSWRDRFGCLVGAVVAVSLCYGLRAMLPPQTAASVPTSNGDPGLMALGALGDYTGLIFYPSNLHMDRTLCMNDKIGTNAAWLGQPHFRLLTFIGAAALLAFIVLAIWKGPGRRLRWFAIGWFLIGFLPISNLYPLNAQVAEHWIYMPSAGFLLLVVGTVFTLRNAWQPVLVGALWLALIPLTIRTAVRASDWTNPIDFYTRTIENGGGTSRTHTNLAVAYFYAGNLAKSQQILEDTVQKFPDYINARIVLGIVYAKQHRTDLASKNLYLDKQKGDALANEFPKTWQASLNYAKVQIATQHPDAARQALDEAIARTPEVWDLIEFKATILEQQKRPQEALEVVQTYANAHWWHYQSWLRLGELHLTLNEPDAAIAAFQHASQLDIHSAQPFQGIAAVELARQDPQAALEWQKKAIARANALPRNYLFLAQIYDALHQPTQAQEAFQQARDLGGEAKAEKGSDLLFN